MVCPVTSSAVPIYPTILGADERCEEYPFSNPENKEIDLQIMRTGLPRALSVLVTLISQHNKQKYQTPDLLVREYEVTRPNNIFLEFPGVRGEETTMRYLVPNLEKFIEQPHFFIIGFFGCAMETSTVIKQIWDLDDKLVGAIPTFDGILAYITLKKDDGQYFNYVFLENFDMVAKWRGLRAHESAVFYSPKYYNNVRINHCILPCSIGSLVENQSNINKLDIVRTKYYAYKNDKFVWSALRVYKKDTLYKSIAFKQHPRPLTFASFLGCNAFSFYSELVSEIGKAIGLPVQMIDIAKITANVNPRPSDLSSIEKYNVDFAFTCGISYVTYFPNLIPLVAPVKVEERYQDKPIYFSDIIVKANSPYHTIEDLESSKFVINEKISLSGSLMPQYHFLNKGGLQKYFGQVLESSSHANSIEYVLDGKADAAGIDSVVLDMEFNQRPERKEKLRIIESTAPCTMPPFVAATWVPRKTQQLMTRALSRIHNSEKVQSLLKENGFSRFATVTDKDYESVRTVRKMYHN